jgi:hypothetical protein
MKNAVLNLLLGCRHKRLTRPMTPGAKGVEQDHRTYVVCLDCGTQLAYDLNAMRVGKPLATAPAAGMPEQREKSRKRTWYLALVSLAPIAWMLRVAFRHNGKTHPSDSKDATK